MDLGLDVLKGKYLVVEDAVLFGQHLIIYSRAEKKINHQEDNQKSCCEQNAVDKRFGPGLAERKFFLVCLVNHSQFGSIVFLLPNDGRIYGLADGTAQAERFLCAPGFPVGHVAGNVSRVDVFKGHAGAVGFEIGTVKTGIAFCGLIVTTDGHQVACGN